MQSQFRGDLPPAERGHTWLPKKGDKRTTRMPSWPLMMELDFYLIETISCVCVCFILFKLLMPISKPSSLPKETMIELLQAAQSREGGCRIWSVLPPGESDFIVNHVPDNPPPANWSEEIVRRVVSFCLDARCCLEGCQGLLRKDVYTVFPPLGTHTKMGWKG